MHASVITLAADAFGIATEQKYLSGRLQLPVVACTHLPVTDSFPLRASSPKTDIRDSAWRLPSSPPESGMRIGIEAGKKLGGSRGRGSPSLQIRARAFLPNDSIHHLHTALPSFHHTSSPFSVGWYDGMKINFVVSNLCIIYFKIGKKK